jgi:hypothetical protein
MVASRAATRARVDSLQVAALEVQRNDEGDGIAAVIGARRTFDAGSLRGEPAVPAI